MAAEYAEPIATIQSATRAGDVTRIAFDLDRVPFESDELWPANLFNRREPEVLVLELHRLVLREENVLSFESYDLGGPLPASGEQFIFMVVFGRRERDLIQNTELIWSRETYVHQDDHEHCPLTYETISGHEGDEREGYRSGDVWISVAAYEKYIRDDVLRLRSGT